MAGQKLAHSGAQGASLALQEPAGTHDRHESMAHLAACGHGRWTGWLALPCSTACMRVPRERQSAAGRAESRPEATRLPHANRQGKLRATCVQARGSMRPATTHQQTRKQGSRPSPSPHGAIPGCAEEQLVVRAAPREAGGAAQARSGTRQCTSGAARAREGPAPGARRRSRPPCCFRHLPLA